MITHKIGDLLESDCDYICHQVNCQGKMNSGIAKSIREKWPAVYNNYIIKCETADEEAIRLYGGYEMAPSGSDMLLGDIQIIDLADNEYDTYQYVINMFAQQYYGYDGKRYTSYDAFWSCLNKIKNNVPKGKKIGFPGFIGCVRGGANWNIVYEMINEVLGKDYDVYIYFLEAKENGKENI